MMLSVMRLQAAKEILRADDDTVSYLLAGLILGTGVVGTLGGGKLLIALSCTLMTSHEDSAPAVPHPMCWPCSLPCVSAHLGGFAELACPEVSQGSSTWLHLLGAGNPFLAGNTVLHMRAGWVLDLVGSSLRNAMLLQMGASCMALVACLTAFLVSPSLVVFAILLAFGLLGIFLVQAPLCELPRLQPVSSSLSSLLPPSLCSKAV